MDRRDPVEVLVVAAAGRHPSLDEIAARTSGLEQVWSDATLAQLIAAASAADRWLADHPDDAAAFLDDPVRVITAMSDAGVLTEPVDDLLDILRARPRAARRDSGRVVRFAAEPPSQATARPDPGWQGAR